jgi:hypothetical protein
VGRRLPDVRVRRGRRALVACTTRSRARRTSTSRPRNRSGRASRRPTTWC